jgi:putative ATP-binding cassette transporter
MMFMPQHPYLPLGSLRGAIAYPAAPRRFPDAQILAALERCGLPRPVDRLDETEHWDRILSLGEQQRLAFARLLLRKPRWVFMDEATASLDDANHDAMMNLFQEELVGSGPVSIGHRPGLDVHRDRTLTLVRTPEGAELTARRRRQVPRRPGPVVAAGPRAIRRLFRRA